MKDTKRELFSTLLDLGQQGHSEVDILEAMASNARYVCDEHREATPGYRHYCGRLCRELDQLVDRMNAFETYQKQLGQSPTGSSQEAPCLIP